MAHCKECQKARGKAHYAANRLKYREIRRLYAERTREEQIDRGRKFYASIHGRAKTLLNAVSLRSRNKGWEVGIDYDFIRIRLEIGTCEVTGIPFDFKPPEGSKKNPFSPSVDRIDPNQPYTYTNSRVVIWQFNMMKAEMSDQQLVDLCRVIVEKMT